VVGWSFVLQVGVGQPDRCHDTTSTVLLLLSLFPAALLPFCAGVPAIGVGHPANAAALGTSLGFSPVPALAFQSSAKGVGQPVRHATAAKSGPWLRIASSNPPSNVRTPFSASAAVGVGHPVEPVSDVRSTDARRRERDRPDPVSQAFQVILYKVDPSICVFARNLLSKDDCRAALADEPVEVRPEVPLVSKPSSFACRAERLARTGTSPNRSIVWPAGAAKRERPDADTGKEMALGEVLQVGGVYILDAPCVDFAGRYVARGDQVAQPLGRVCVNLVVVGGHAVSLRCCSAHALRLCSSLARFHRTQASFVSS
jgi:hypothetical protein